MSDKKHLKALKRKDKKKQGQAKKEQINKTNKEAERKIASFSKMPSNCTTCQAPFDNESRQAHMEWKVAVRGDKVRLFCPECQKKALEAAATIEEGVQDEN